jgi:hypothetical protein
MLIGLVVPLLSLGAALADAAEALVLLEAEDQAAGAVARDEHDLA